MWPGIQEKLKIKDFSLVWENTQYFEESSHTSKNNASMSFKDGIGPKMNKEELTLNLPCCPFCQDANLKRHVRCWIKGASQVWTSSQIPCKQSAFFNVHFQMANMIKCFVRLGDKKAQTGEKPSHMFISSVSTSVHFQMDRKGPVQERSHLHVTHVTRHSWKIEFYSK